MATINNDDERKMLSQRSNEGKWSIVNGTLSDRNNKATPNITQFWSTKQKVLSAHIHTSSQPILSWNQESRKHFPRDIHKTYYTAGRSLWAVCTRSNNNEEVSDYNINTNAWKQNGHLQRCTGRTTGAGRDPRISDENVESPQSGDINTVLYMHSASFVRGSYGPP